MALELWDVHPMLNLSEACAAFYLTMDLDIDGLDTENTYKEIETYLTRQFSNYTDMVVGGELRHAAHKVKAKAEIPTRIAHALKSVLLVPSRSEAWLAWYHLRRTYGVQALRWAEVTFKLFKGGGYGGPAWANIAAHLRRWEQGEYGNQLFVDFCWGLEHNGGNYFNKVWHPPNKHLLDAKQESNMAAVAEHATAETREYYRKQRQQEVAPDGSQDM